MHGETILEDQGWNLKQPKQYKAPLVLYTGVDCCWRWISVNLEYLLYIGFDYDLQLTRH
jgi:hypothetical protein